LRISAKSLFFVPVSISIAFLIGFPCAAKNSAHQEYRHNFDEFYEIRRLETAKEYKQALLKCKELIDKHPDFFFTYPVFVRISQKGSELDESIELLRQHIQKNPDRNEYSYGLGLGYKAQEEYKKASEIYKQAIDKGANFLLIYYELLVIARTKEECQSLIGYFERLSKDQPDNSYPFYGIAAIYQYKLGQFDLALENYVKAVEVARTAGDKLQEGEHLNMIGNYYWGRSNFAKALEHYLKAVDAIQGTDAKTQLISYLYNSGLMYCYLGQPLKGGEYYKKALMLAEEMGHKEEKAKILRSIGFTHAQTSAYSIALDFYQDALEIAKDIRDRQKEAQCLMDIADVSWKRGSFSQAIKKYKESLGISRESGNRSSEFWTLVGMANVFLKTGEFSRSLEYYLKALEVNKQLKIRHQDAVLFSNIANIYANTGDHSKALDYYNQALDIHLETGSKNYEGITLNNIARLYSEQKDYKRALAFYQKALQIAKETGDKRFEANRLNNLADTYTHLENFSEALKCYVGALELAQNLGTKEIEANVACSMGYLFEKSKGYAKAEEFFLKGLSISQEIGYSQKTWMAYAGLASVHKKQGEYPEALKQYKEALKVIEGMRSQIQLGEQRSGFLSGKFEIYISLVSLLYELNQKQPMEGFGEESYHIAEKAKARAFLDSLQEGKTNLGSQLSMEFKEEENELLRKISAIQTELLKPQLSELKRVDYLKELEKVEEDYLHLIQRIRSSHPGYAQLVYPEPYQLDVIRKKLLGPETAILEYLMGETDTFLFFVTESDFSIHKLSSRKDLEDRVNDYASLLKTGAAKEFQAFSAGKRLYQELIGPVKDKIGSIKRLIIIPDGKLNFLPFETLIDPRNNGQSHYLINDFRISYAPSANALISLLDRKNPKTQQKDLLAFADPDYDYSSNSSEKIDADDILREFYMEQGFDFSPLKYSAEEVSQISKLIKKKARDVYTKKDAKEEKIKSLHLADYEIIHFATHGFIDEQVPLRSSLLMALDEDPGEDGFFQAREIYSTVLNANLVVLSACQTGRGKLERGEGVMGLARAFLYAGAESVVASLWSINDKATSVFMSYFYKGLSQGMSKEEALQKAKQEMIKSRYKHPFYWAPFVLNGDAEGMIKIHKPSFWEKMF
jgi:CHAT domain-containing protein/Tfp pilus assembly protein PilF